MKKRIVPVGWLFMALVSMAASAAPSAARSAFGLQDAVDVAAAGSEAAHGFAHGGDARRGMAGAWVGGHDWRRVARTVHGRNGWVSYRLRVHPHRATTLEIEELYGRDRGVRGYAVMVDGRPAHFRTFPGSGAGPVHYFVQVPPTGRETLTVRFVNAGDTPFTINRLWAFSDFDRYFDENRLAVPFYVAPTVHLGWRDMEADAARLRQIKESLGPHPNIRPAFTTFVNYAALDDREMAERLDYVLALAAKVGMPAQVQFDTWWANTPDGSDGRGGFWTDVPYQQVVYNEDRRRYHLSIPNQWSSTPWLSVNHPALNAYKRERLASAMAMMRRRYAALRAAGKSHLLLAINQDNEPVYWASGNAGLGEDSLLADFNRSAVASAKAGGVTLDPTDGLSFAERHWLWRNLLRYNEMVGATIARGLGDDATVVSASGAAPPWDLLRFNVYTQAMMMSRPALEYPMLDAAYPLWESAAPRSARVGPEYNADRPAERQGLLHAIALGRSAGTNAEAGQDASNMRSVRPGYALAQRYIALYNYPLDKMDVAASETGDLSAPFPPLTYQRVHRAFDFRDDAWKDSVFSHEDIQTGQIGNTAAIAAHPAANDRPGRLTFRLDAPSGGWKGLHLEVLGRARNFKQTDPAVNIRILAGRRPDALREVGRFHDTGEITEADRLDLSTEACGDGPVYVQLEMNAPGLDPTVLSWVAAHRVLFTVPWEGRVAPAWKQDVSLGTVRKQNLVVSWRSDAERAIADLAARIARGHGGIVAAPGKADRAPGARLAAARAALRRGAYGIAVREASAGLSGCLPAAFEVLAPGWLTPYPARLEANAPVSVVVEEWSGNVIRLRMAARAATPVGARLETPRPGVRYAVERQGDLWTVRPAARGAFRADARGGLNFRATTAVLPTPPLARTVEGLFRSGTARPGEVIATPDAGGRTAFMTDARTRITRNGRMVKLPDLRRGDRIAARIGPDGVALEVTATYRMVNGTVAAFQPTTPHAMPAVTLSGGGTHVVDLNAPLRLGGTDADIVLRTQGTGFAPLKKGDTVRLRVDPRTGRAFEVWKDL